MSAQRMSVGEPDRSPRPARSYWAGRLVLVILALVVAEYGYARHAWVVGSLGLAVAVAAFAYAWFTRRRDRRTLRR